MNLTSKRLAEQSLQSCDLPSFKVNLKEHSKDTVKPTEKLKVITCAQLVEKLYVGSEVLVLQKQHLEQAKKSELFQDYNAMSCLTA